MNIPTDLAEFLKWLATPVIVGAIVSWLLSKWTGYNDLGYDAKRAIAVGVSFVLGAGLYAFVTYVPADFITAASPFFKAGVSAVLTLLGTQSAFALFFNGSKGASFEADFN